MTILSAIILLGVLIFVHELGHFIFAKMLGVKVLKFSLGFGPKLIGTTVGETEYLLSAVPLGGYVKMLGEEPDSEISEEDRERSFHNRPVWNRFAIVLSGPLFNLFFASFIFFCIFLTGVPASKPVAGKIAAGLPAEASGIKTGDVIAEINGKPVTSWDEVDSAVDESGGSALKLRVRRAEGIVDLSVTPRKTPARNLFGEKKEIWDIGLYPLIKPVVGDVMKGSRAESAGVKKGDVITEIDGRAVSTWQDMTDIIHSNPEKELVLSVSRGGSVMEIRVKPEKKSMRGPDGKEKAVGLIGIGHQAEDFTKRFGPVKSAELGVKKTWELSVFTLVSIEKLIERVIPADNIGGPIMIFQMAGKQAAHGPSTFFTFMAVISINLGVLNLLPVPVLDGGHLLFMCIELVRRKPLSEKVVMTAQKIGIALLVTLSVFAFYNDIVRLLAGTSLP